MSDVFTTSKKSWHQRLLQQKIQFQIKGSKNEVSLKIRSAVSIPKEKTLGKFDANVLRHHVVHFIDFRRAREEWRAQGGVDIQKLISMTDLWDWYCLPAWIVDFWAWIYLFKVNFLHMWEISIKTQFGEYVLPFPDFLTANLRIHQSHWSVMRFGDYDLICFSLHMRLSRFRFKTSGFLFKTTGLWSLDLFWWFKWICRKMVRAKWCQSDVCFVHPFLVSWGYRRAAATNAVND